MKPNIKTAMVFMPQDDCYPEHEHDVKIRNLSHLNTSCYLCAAQIPLEEFDSQNPQDIAQFYIRQSVLSHWHSRGMRKLQHMDILTVGLKAYILLDARLAAASGLKLKQIPQCPSMVLGGPLPISEPNSV